MELAQDRVQRWTLVSAVLNLRVLLSVYVKFLFTTLVGSNFMQHIFFCPTSSSVYNVSRSVLYNGVNGVEYLFQIKINIRVDICTHMEHRNIFLHI
jgi:hypothetical protein